MNYEKENKSNIKYYNGLYDRRVRWFRTIQILAFSEISRFVSHTISSLVYQYFNTSIIYAYIAGALHDSKSHSDREDRDNEKNCIDFRNCFSDFHNYRRRIRYSKSWAIKCRICNCPQYMCYDMFRILPK